MKYIANVEIEYETEGDPLETLQLILNRVGWERVGTKWVRLTGAGPYAEHYHILMQPKALTPLGGQHG